MATFDWEVVKSSSQRGRDRAAPDRRFDGGFRSFLAQGLLGALADIAIVLKPVSYSSCRIMILRESDEGKVRFGKGSEHGRLSLC